MVMITAQSDAPLDMYETAISSFLVGSVSSATSNQATLSYGSLFTDTLDGFGLIASADGGFDAGIVTTITERYGDKVTFVISGLNESAEQLVNWSLTGDTSLFFEKTFAGDDIIVGSDLSDRLFTLSGKDIIYAKGGDDVIEVGTGNKVIDGGAGFDELFITEASSDFLLLKQSDADYLVSNSGRYKITGVEAIYFGSDEKILSTDLATVVKSFDPLQYVASNEDLRIALGTDIAAATRHYAAYGFTEERPIKSFDVLTYVAAYSDLRAAFGMDTVGATRHYIQVGAAEKRTERFDALSYIASYGDLIKLLGDNVQAGASHFIQSGASERRSITFDPIKYIASNPSLYRNIGSGQSAAAEHYITVGYAEGLKTDNFKALQYIASYDDLRSTYGTNSYAATKHYVDSGISEGRSILFNAAAYAQANPDLKSVFGDNADLLAKHYIEFGWNEHRSLGGIMSKSSAAMDVSDRSGEYQDIAHFHYSISVDSIGGV